MRQLKKNKTIATLLLTGILTITQTMNAQTFEWANSMGGASLDQSEGYNPSN